MLLFEQLNLIILAKWRRLHVAFALLRLSTYIVDACFSVLCFSLHRLRFFTFEVSESIEVDKGY